MDGMRDQGTSWRQRRSGESPDADAVPELTEWLDMEAWRAGWQPLPDPHVGIEQLQAILHRVVRHGYAAYLRGERVMPDRFFSDELFASMWQTGYTHARMDAELMACPGVVIPAEQHPVVC